MRSATTAIAGVVELATATEFNTGTDRARVASVRVIREFYDLRIPPTGGTTGQLLAKASNADYNYEWVDAPTGGGGAAATNLAVGPRSATTLVITSSTGTNASIPIATTLLAGLQSAQDKDRLDELWGRTLSVTQSSVAATIALGTLSDEIGPATRTQAGLQIPADKIKIDGLNLLRLVAAGGRAGQIYAKRTDSDYDGEWINAPTGGGGTTTLTGTLASFTPLSNSGALTLAEPTAVLQWSPWLNLVTHTASTAGVRIAQALIDAAIQSQASAGANWAAITAAGATDRVWVEVAIVNGTTDEGTSIVFVRNGGYKPDADSVKANLVAMVDMAANDVLTFRARWAMEQVGAQGHGGQARVAARLQFAAGQQQLKVADMGAVAHHNTPPPDHQIYLLFRSTGQNNVPTAAEFKAASDKTTSGSIVVTGHPNTQVYTYPAIWSEEQLTYIAQDNVGLVTPTNQLDDYTESRLTIDGVNGYAYVGARQYEESANTTWRFR